MQSDDQLLAEALMEDAAMYMMQGLLDEAAEILAVAEKLEFGSDPFCAFSIEELEIVGDGEARAH